LRPVARPLWADDEQEHPAAGSRAPLGASTTADVCIVGAGYTGLWTAYALALLRPQWSILVVEQQTVGFGASGRNGGWLADTVTGGRASIVTSHGRAAAEAMQSALTASVDEVERVCVAEGIDAGIRRGGELVVALSKSQLMRAEAFVRAESAWSGASAVLLDEAALASRIRIAGAVGATWQPHCATLHPGRLVRGLAAAVERRGVRIAEGTRAARIEPGRLEHQRGVVRARSILRATEGFTGLLPGERRSILPMNSSIIATEPLSAALWDDIGWREGEALGDWSHVYTYAQRTADDRIVLGGRGVPYRYAGRFDERGETQESTVRALRGELVRRFPMLHDARITHAWSGVLGVPRTWSASVEFDPATGLGSAQGYVGTGVTAANLAGRTLADLCAGVESPLTALPWVGRRSPRWEPEPLRWLGVHGLYAAYRTADRLEARGGGRTSRIARLADLVAGRS